jgi:transposase-like protein
MAKRKYTDETKAAVLAALLAGQSVSHVAKEYKMPVGTVKGWKSKELNATENNAVITQKKAALGDLILGLLEEELISLQEMSRAFRDREWLAKQNAADAAVLFGVMQDKAFRKIEALDRGNARPDD